MFARIKPSRLFLGGAMSIAIGISCSTTPSTANIWEVPGCSYLGEHDALKLSLDVSAGNVPALLVPGSKPMRCMFDGRVEEISVPVKKEDTAPLENRWEGNFRKGIEALPNGDLVGLGVDREFLQKLSLRDHATGVNTVLLGPKDSESVVLEDDPDTKVSMRVGAFAVDHAESIYVSGLITKVTGRDATNVVANAFLQIVMNPPRNSDGIWRLMRKPDNTWVISKVVDQPSIFALRALPNGDLLTVTGDGKPEEFYKLLVHPKVRDFSASWGAIREKIVRTYKKQNRKPLDQSPHGLATTSTDGILFSDHSTSAVWWYSPRTSSVMPISKPMVITKHRHKKVSDGELLPGALLEAPDKGVFVHDYRDNAIRYIAPAHDPLDDYLYQQVSDAVSAFKEKKLKKTGVVTLNLAKVIDDRALFYQGVPGVNWGSNYIHTLPREIRDELRRFSNGDLKMWMIKLRYRMALHQIQKEIRELDSKFDLEALINSTRGGSNASASHHN